MSTVEIIDKFVGKYSFLNNFYEASIWIDGKQYKTCEHAYQAHKTLDESVRELIRKAKTPIEAKKLGRCIVLRSDWDQVKIQLMRSFIEQKFENPFLGHKLLETGEIKLVHNNKWNDSFWGICRGVGENWLGKILEETRTELRREMKEYERIQSA